MDEYNSFLVTVLHGEELIRCAVKTELNFLNMEKAGVWAKLPMHVRSYGEVVKVERIFDIASEEC
jgi:hypothetical protein